MAIIILAGADIDNYDWLGHQINKDDFIICADSGLRHAHAIGVKPNIIIGDFDSVAKDLLKTYEGQSTIIHDDNQTATDLMKALTKIDASHPTHIYGAIGQRADHDFSTILILKSLPHPDNITLIAPTETRRVVKSSSTITGQKGDIVGIFPLCPIKNMCFDGLKYPADDLDHPHDFG